MQIWDINLEIAESAVVCQSQNWLGDTKITCMFKICMSGAWGAQSA